MREFKNIIEAYIDDEGNVCYMVEGSEFIGTYVISPQYFNFVQTTPYIGRLEIFHLHRPDYLMVSFNMETNYDEFEMDMAMEVARYIENYC